MLKNLALVLGTFFLSSLALAGPFNGDSTIHKAVIVGSGTLPNPPLNYDSNTTQFVLLSNGFNTISGSTLTINCPDGNLTDPGSSGKQCFKLSFKNGADQNGGVAGGNSILTLNNPLNGGQTSIGFVTNGAQVGKIRDDFLGNIYIVPYSGGGVNIMHSGDANEGGSTTASFTASQTQIFSDLSVPASNFSAAEVNGINKITVNTTAVNLSGDVVISDFNGFDYLTSGQDIGIDPICLGDLSATNSGVSMCIAATGSVLFNNASQFTVPLFSTGLIASDVLGNLSSHAPSTGLTLSGGVLSSNAIQTISYQPGLLSSVNATKGVFSKISKTSTVDNIECSAITFSCVANPTITLFECGTSATCSSSPVTIGTCTVTAAGTVVNGTVSNPAITAGDYVAWAETAGTCASIDVAVTAQLHSN